ncbi:MAG: patatin-like phospholipase family protein [Aphanocapsa lilacina HA4352-LM1]|jgi:NTE family protein|nr:patatin-like phospholipase family protein [Aphanocapsa lilacina HA4352-LM1]
MGQFLLQKIKSQLPALELEADISFYQLNQLKLPLLKIVSSDLRTKGPLVYSGQGGDEQSGSVLDAVRASMSYPFVFKPVQVNDRYLVDGGLSSNLPVFLFEKERRDELIPVFAFDLVAPHSEPGQEYGIKQFGLDMISTALESNDFLMRKVIPKTIYYIPVSIPKDIGTLDFGLSKERRIELYNAGYVATTTFFNSNLPQLDQATTSVEALQALYIPPTIVTPLLMVIARQFQEHTGATNVRANLMLPTERSTLLVVYQFGMDSDPDIDLELPFGTGSCGRAWQERDIVATDLLAAHQDGMSKALQNRVRRDRKAVLSVPIFEWTPTAQPRTELDRIGVLSVDTDAALDATGWVRDHKRYVNDTALSWSAILAKLLDKG